ncbi:MULTISPECIES: response regulator transcription factor [Streptomyces]|uniref:response regulator transcription factor n=1 Tax=Streptomyces TaxID=1883 RepID=UPI00116203C1|nr:MULTISPECIES: response regulator transcription factor [unclassified Streptomyces]NMI54707.1 response regulator transcription factor [Streptomyces sp. RLA2-12]QDN62740.1 response regulator transcription factor [Streptomyces sp. S1D4-20]QDN72790.1 response regulator transcription factor [Streptomyces sp. S1D4-14]QDN83095.1 response regulator transcription factor [Streptomyces sp. S1A1-7]QDO03502.1 response regulator transcription factor [Streptomyces sp. RLB1-9]
MNSPDTVLVVEDDAGIRDLMASALSFAGFDVQLAEDVPQALTHLAQRPPDVMVLDVGLPGGDGFEVLQLIRSRGITVPVLFLTSRDAIEDRVRGFKLGGDDYVTKPFSVVEVTARLQALIRRSRGSAGAAADDGILRYADLELDDKRHTVRRGGDTVDLSPTEFRLLHYLLSHPGHVMTRSQILEAVWQYDFGGDSVVVERFVSNLRRKLDHGREPLIHTVRGIGYSLRRPAS